MSRPLFELWPRLVNQVGHVELGDFPTPVESLAPLALPGAELAYTKRDDLSSPHYGGNKVRTLEFLFGSAKRLEARQIWATGAFGSNHAVATVLHAPRVDLEPGAILVPQPKSFAALENLVVTATCSELHPLAHWSLFPFGWWRHLGRSPRTVIMAPGGATPWGALGYVSAALELAEQVDRAELPAPEKVVLGVGSTCTTAGLLVGFLLATRLALGFKRRAPTIVAVRVTPWPITAVRRIVSLALATSRLLERLTGDARAEMEPGILRAHLEVDGRFLGRGYGRPTEEGRRAIELWQRAGLNPLDTTYSGKAAACVARGLEQHGFSGPILFWSTKSSAPLPVVSREQLLGAPRPVLRWLRRAARQLGKADELPPSMSKLLLEVR